MAPRSRFDVTRRHVLHAGLACGLAAPFIGAARAASGLIVFAAASLKPPLDEIAATWDGPELAISYAGSGTLARQAARGAPADLVILAATDWMEWLVGQGALAGAPRVVAANSLALVGPPGGAPLALDRSAVLDRLGPRGRFAMGDPMSAPVGRYGQQALETLGLWQDLQPRAILAENVRAALAYVARGDVDLGLVYGSDTVGTGVATLAKVPAEAHQPIRYPGATLAGAHTDAPLALARIATAGDIFARHGFAPVPPV